jgi:diacylglycerol kinase (ATP)
MGAPVKASGFWYAFRHAGRGLVYTVAHQPNMRVHVMAALWVGLVGSGIPLGLAEKVTLLFCIQLVFFAEILNSALEALVDLATRQFDEKARVTKDAAAAGVLVLALGTVVIFAALLVHSWGSVTQHLPQVWRQVELGLPMSACAAILLWGRLPAAAARLATLALALVLWTTLLGHTESYVFSAVNLGLLLLAWSAARARQATP